MKDETKLTGIIICGGMSSRMGTDKSLLFWNGLKYYEHVNNILKEFCEEIYISCRSVQKANYELPVIADKYEDRGPMAGIVSCLEQLAGHTLLTLPCDMPLLDPEILKKMILLNEGNIDGVFIKDATGRIEPMIGLYNPSIFDNLSAYFHSGQDSLYRFIESAVNVSYLQLKNDQLTNVNTPEDHLKISGKNILNK